MDDKLFNTIFEAFGAILLSMLEFLPSILRIAILAATFIHIMLKVKKEYSVMPMGSYGYGNKKMTKKKGKTMPAKKKKIKKKK